MPIEAFFGHLETIEEHRAGRPDPLPDFAVDDFLNR